MGASSTPTFQNLGDTKSGDHTKELLCHCNSITLFNTINMLQKS